MVKMMAYIVSFQYNVFWFFALLSMIFNSGPTHQLKVAYIGTALQSNIANTAFVWALRVRYLNRIKVIDITNSLVTSYNTLATSDYVIIQGGNTKYMLDTWQTTGFKQILNRLRENKKMPTLIGISAGSYWLFTSGISDSIPGKWTKLDGYDWIHSDILFHADNTEVRQGMTRLEYFNQTFTDSSLKTSLNNNRYIKVQIP